jgi:hypothetical protein
VGLGLDLDEDEVGLDEDEVGLGEDEVGLLGVFLRAAFLCAMAPAYSNGTRWARTLLFC